MCQHIHYIYNSPIGPLQITANGQGLTELHFTDLASAPPSQPPPGSPILAETCRWLDIYFAGGQPDFFPPLQPAGTAFRQAVWQLLRQIPYGQTTTYGRLAQEIAAAQGRQHMSAQAIGGAVGHNPIGIIIPCHRVIGADGSLTGFASGLDKKQALLAIEGITLNIK